MPKHLLSNTTISKVISFFAWATLIIGISVAAILIFSAGLDITWISALIAVSSLIGSVTVSFLMLAIARILENTSVRD